MVATIIAQRYAKALLQSVTGEGVESRIAEEASALVAAIGDDADVKRFLVEPIRSAEDKLGVLLASFEKPPHPLFAQFLRTVMENRRERFLAGMLKEFLKLLRDARGEVQAELSTAFKLDERQRKLLETELSARFKRKVELLPLVNDSLIGGATLRLGDTIYDGSLRNSLSKLESLLKKEPIKKQAAPAKATSEQKKKIVQKTKKAVPKAKKAAKKKRPQKRK